MDLFQGGPLLGVRPGDPPSREAGGRAREASRGAGAAPAGFGVRDRRQAREALAAFAAEGPGGGLHLLPPAAVSGPGVAGPSLLSVRVRQGGDSCPRRSTCKQRSTPCTLRSLPSRSTWAIGCPASSGLSSVTTTWALSAWCSASTRS